MPTVRNETSIATKSKLFRGLGDQRGRFAIYHLSDPRVDELVTVAEALLVEVARGVATCGRYGEVENC